MANSSVSTSFELINLQGYVTGIEKSGDALDNLSAKTKSFNDITADIRKSLTETQKSVTDLGTSAQKVDLKPTISRYWENEENKVRQSVKNIETETAKVSGKGYIPSGRPTFVPSSAFGTPAPSVTGTSSSNIGYGESEFNTAAKGFKSVGDEAEKSAAKVEKLNGHIGRIRGFGALFRELNLGINETELNAGIAVFEKFRGAGDGAGEIDGAKRLAALTRVKELNVAVTQAEALATTTASAAELGDAAAKEAATAASVSLTAAKRAETAATFELAVAEGTATAGAASLAGGVAAVDAAAAPLAAIFTAIAAPLVLGGAAIAIAYHIVSNVRTEAERRLKVEEQIAGTLNKQLLSAKQLTFEFNQQEANAQQNRNFTRSVTGETVEQLTARRSNVQSVIDRLPKSSFTADGKDETSQFFANELAQKRQEVSELNKLIDERKDKDKKDRDDAYTKNSDNFTKSAEQARKYDDEKVKRDNELAKKRADDLEKANAKTVELNDLLVSYAAKENPFVKNFNEIETATKRAQKQFGIFGDSVVNKIADIEKANLLKAINLQGFENNFSALTLRQQAQKLNATPENQFADFQRANERVSAAAQSLVTITKLQKEIDALTGGSLQSDIARSGIRREDRKFKEDFEDSQKGLESQLRDNTLRGLQNFENIGSFSAPNDLKRLLKDSSDEGLNKFLRSRANFVDFQEDKSFKDRADKEKINDALAQVADLKKISVEGAGITGQGIVSKQIADILGAVKDVRTNPAAASAIREDLTKANQDLIRANKNELTDKLENLKFQDFGKIFARQQIDLINGSGITDDEKIKRRLSVTEALGNDLDPSLKEQRVRDLTREAQIKDDQQKEGLQISKDIKTLIEGVFAALTSDGIALDPASKKALKQAVDVTIKDQTAAGAEAKQQTAAANPQNVEDYYRGGGSFNLIRR